MAAKGNPGPAEKQRIRKLLGSAPAPSSFELAQAGRLVCATLTRLPIWSRATLICLYHALGSEIPTDDIVAAARARGMAVAAPRLAEHGGLVFHLLPASRDWRAVFAPHPTLRISEPHPELPVVDLARHTTMLVVPGVAFDPSGGRLGRGGGAYDRLLAGHVDRRPPVAGLNDAAHRQSHAGNHLPSLLAIGVVLDRFVLSAVPLEPHDQRVGVIVTESRLIDTRSGPFSRSSGLR